MNVLSSKKPRLLIEIIACFCLMTILGAVFNRIADILNADGLWVGILTYLMSAVVIVLYVVKIEKKPISYIGLKEPALSDIPKGLLLGVCMFAVQQIPFLLMRVDYSVFAAEPDWGNIMIMSLYCFLCVGLTEELIFRGFILQKTQELSNRKVIIVAINCLLFYAFHWPPVRFVFGEFFNITVNTLFLCIYFYKSKNKSIVPLMIAHGFYDILTAYLLPAFLYIAR
ncbi:MAG TPA: hypothetical protein DDW34_08435 [Clostridium sp.]|nr:hypothetical protein [Clostridium sp.]